MALKRYKDFVNENNSVESTDDRLLNNAKFKKGDKVEWSIGDHDYYTIDYSFTDNGRVLYNLRNPQGISAGGRVPEYELSIFNGGEIDGSHVITEDDARKLFGLEEDNFLGPDDDFSDDDFNKFVKDVVGKTLDEYSVWRYPDEPEEQLEEQLEMALDVLQNN